MIALVVGAPKQPHKHGMSYLITQACMLMLANAGGPIYQRLDSVVELNIYIVAMLTPNREAAEGLAEAEIIKKELYALGEAYVFSVDSEEYHFIGRGKINNQISDLKQRLMNLAQTYDLIDPSFLREYDAPAWGEIR